jgi:quercetin dioxygenase-like cupin family protein
MRFTLVAAVAVIALGISPMTIAQDIVAPTVTSAISDAPGRGILPGVSEHYAAMPALYELDAQPIEQITPLVQRQMLYGSQSTIVKWTVKKGGVFPLHHHANEQVTWITKGRCEVFSQAKKFVLTAGSVLIIPPNVPHEFICTEDSIDIDFFSPQRQDWIDGAKTATTASPH